MQYVILLLGLALAALAAYMLKREQETGMEDFDKLLREEMDRPINRELVALYELQETVERALAELEEKNGVFSQLLLRYEKHREEIESRLQQLDNLQRELQQYKSSFGRREETETVRPKHQEVYRFYDQGMSIAEIASLTGMGRGEVQLIIGLRKSGS
jgi:TolA-binding protein